MIRKKRKLSVKKIVRFLIVLLVIGIIIFLGIKFFKRGVSNPVKRSVDMYLASEINEVTLYNFVKETDEEAAKIVRRIFTLCRINYFWKH